MGFFTASAVTSARVWIDKKDGDGAAYGAYDENSAIIPGDQQLFYALYRRKPVLEGRFAVYFSIVGGGDRPPTAVCGPLDQRTPDKPVGWRE